MASLFSVEADEAANVAWLGLLRQHKLTENFSPSDLESIRLIFKVGFAAGAKFGMDEMHKSVDEALVKALEAEKKRREGK